MAKDPKMDCEDGDTMWKVNVIGANITITEPQNPNDTVIFINGDHQKSNEYVSDSIE